MVSVVTLTYNNFDELMETLQSLEGVPQIEIIVINAGVCDKTKNYLEKSKIVSRYISEKDDGIADGFNKGVSLSLGANIAFLNSGDVLLEKKYYADVENFLNKNLDFDFVHTNLILEDYLMGQTLITPPLCALGFGQPYLHPTMVVRAQVFKKVGAFDLRYKIGMDFDWICRMTKQKIKGYYLDSKPVVQMNGVGISNTKEGAGIIEGIKALYRNKMMNSLNIVGILTRITKFSIKKVLMYFRLSSFVKFVKSKKYKKSLG